MSQGSKTNIFKCDWILCSWLSKSSFFWITLFMQILENYLFIILKIYKKEFFFWIKHFGVVKNKDAHRILNHKYMIRFYATIQKYDHLISKQKFELIPFDEWKYLAIKKTTLTCNFYYTFILNINYYLHNSWFLIKHFIVCRCNGINHRNFSIGNYRGVWEKIEQKANRTSWSKTHLVYKTLVNI